jgi:prepilin-type N-terminal cleavage/methylation domain-containing protein
MQRLHKSAFTLIELLVVIAIIAILAAILFPVFARARESARITTTISNANQIGKAVIMYVQDYDEALPFAGHSNLIYQNPDLGRTEWQEAIYPYVKNEQAYRSADDSTQCLDRNVTADEVANQTSTYACSSFLFNYLITQEVAGNGGTTRQSVALAGVVQPASFIMMMNGERGVTANNGDQTRLYGGLDHNGQQLSLWLAEYVQNGTGNTQHLFNQCGYSNLGSSLPQHKSGIVFAFLDGHTKFAPVTHTTADPTGNTGPAHDLEGRYPWLQYGVPDPNNYSDYRFWNGRDSAGPTCENDPR